MIDPDDRERAALAHAMKSMGLLMGEIGWTVSFKDLTAAQAESLAEAAVDGFQESMRASAPHESSEVPF
jgi:molybdopterin biosynthesis enzyme MoaB